MFLTNKFREFDVYAKPLDDFRVKTPFGGIVTILSLITIILLTITETISFLRPEIVEELYVDSTSAEQNLDIYFDIKFEKLHCDLLSVDIMDVGGMSQYNIKDDVFKQRVDKNGLNITDPIRQGINQNTSVVQKTETSSSYCGSCYGASDGCCNTCEDVKSVYELRGWSIENILEIEQCKNDAYVKKLQESQSEGCRIWGRVEVAKCEGNFHIAPGSPVSSHRQHFHDLHSISVSEFNTTHTINQLSFGKPYPEKNYPLNEKRFVSLKGGIMHQYFIKVVPTLYSYQISKPGEEESTYQFSVTRNERDLAAGNNGLPGFFMQYSFSPLMVHFEERRPPLSQFLVSLCAIIGGTYTVASLIDSLIYRTIQYKFE